MKIQNAERLVQKCGRNLWGRTAAGHTPWSLCSKLFFALPWFPGPGSGHPAACSACKISLSDCLIHWGLGISDWDSIQVVGRKLLFWGHFVKALQLTSPLGPWLPFGGNSRSRSRSLACLIKSQSHPVAGMLRTASRAFSCCPCIFLCPRGRIG